MVMLHLERWRNAETSEAGFCRNARNGFILRLPGTSPSNTAVILVFDDSVEPNHKHETPKLVKLAEVLRIIPGSPPHNSRSILWIFSAC